ncbi:LPS assembly protein LptD [Erythrobacter aquimaris]|uniref:LPS-assembly protein LptD n=1 Tax=Qipengyuania aquimaris TaxID=255984 RepID=A0A6I4TM87_9SPHN|nr:LPS assembly protein LptD [Qipengyuania aquimaris]MXO96161.1 LPS assembly protein LptD [Qipengyuania aquimaris]
MLLWPQPSRNTFLHAFGAGAGALALAAAAPLAAQDGAATGAGTVEEPEGESPTDLPPPPDAVIVAQSDLDPPPTAEFNEAGERQIAFASDILSYDSDADIVTAEGNVVLRSGERSVRADSVSWSRRTGVILASGNVRFVDENGNQLFSDQVELTDEFEAGALENLLLALRQGGRLAARRGLRETDGTIALQEAAYSACAVVTPEGCNKDPSWRITADRVIYDPQDSRLRFQGAYLELFGARILPLPGLAIRTDGGAVSGFLVPDLRFSESNGVEVSGSYYIRLADNKDLTVSAYAFTEAPPMVSAQWRHLTDKGAYQITGYATNSRRFTDATRTDTFESEPRGYLFANGKFQFTPEWSLTSSVRLASDRTFLRRYDISRDDRLRSMVDLERIDRNSYFSLAGWATQTLRLNQDQGQVPIALPAMDYRLRLDEPVLGGKVELQANTLAIMRAEGQDTQRAFARAKWDLRKILGLGQVVTLTGLLRGDVYHSNNNFLTQTVSYRGENGWQARGVALGALDVEWPFVGELLGGTQVFTPRVQLVVTPPIRNLAIPNEDARAIDLEDSNLFALNRFPGYDRIEDGARITYGFDWQLRRPGWEVKTTLGQSYRLDADRDIFPDGTGLSEKVSDIVGRTELRFRDFVKLTHRFRLDKDNLAVRRNEFDATVGTSATYVEVGYLRLDRNITSVEDLQDREELRAAARLSFANYWSVFGSGVFNLTNREEDLSLSSDGFQPIRTRLGLAYQDDCLELGLTWRRDYVSAGDAERGDTFQLYFSLKNLGFR